MPIYEYMTDDGRLLEYYKPAAEADELGSVAPIPDPNGGKIAATRIVSIPQVRGDPWKPYVSERLPRNLEGVPCTPGGKPIISNRAQERDVMAKFGYERE